MALHFTPISPLPKYVPTRGFPVKKVKKLAVLTAYAAVTWW
jgi:hypothetical protein